MEVINKTKRILLIDDNKLHLSTVKNILKTKYKIVCSKSGREALEQLNQGFVPNLILLDILMPNMDGWETYLKLKSNSFLQDIPIVFFTSVIERAEKKHAEEMGAADYITKPYKKDDLIERIEKIFKKHLKNVKQEGRTGEQKLHFRT